MAEFGAGRRAPWWPIIVLAFAVLVSLWALCGTPFLNAPSEDVTRRSTDTHFEPSSPLLKGRIEQGYHPFEARDAAEDPASVAGLPPRVLHGKVVSDETGESLEGAFVGGVLAGRGYVITSAGVLTDSSGAFSLEIPDDGVQELLVRASGYLPQRVDSPSSAEAALLVRVARGGTITGVVVDSQGGPLAGAEVLVSSAGAPASWPAVPLQISARVSDVGAITVSDENGRFTAGGLVPSQAYVVRARKRGFLAHYMEASGIRAELGDELRLRLQSVTTVFVHAVDAETGIRLQDASVGGALLQKNTGVYLHSHSRAYDRYVLGLPSGQDGVVCHLAASPRAGELGTVRVKVQVDAAALGYASAREARWITLGEDTHIILSLKRRSPQQWGGIRFHAHTEGGIPFSGRLLLTFFSKAEPPSQLACDFLGGGATDVISLPQGQWLIKADGAPPYGSWWGRAVAGASAEVAVGEVTELRLALRGGRIRVRVCDELGVPLKGFALRVRTEGPSPGVDHEPWNSTAPSQAESALDDDITLWLHPGEAQLRVRLAGYEQTTVKVSVRDAPSPTDVSVVLRRLGRR